MPENDDKRKQNYIGSLGRIAKCAKNWIEIIWTKKSQTELSLMEKEAKWNSLNKTRQNEQDCQKAICHKKNKSKWKQGIININKTKCTNTRHYKPQWHKMNPNYYEKPNQSIANQNEAKWIKVRHFEPKQGITKQNNA